MSDVASLASGTDLLAVSEESPGGSVDGSTSSADKDGGGDGRLERLRAEVRQLRRDLRRMREEQRRLALAAPPPPDACAPRRRHRHRRRSRAADAGESPPAAAAAGEEETAAPSIILRRPLTAQTGRAALLSLPVAPALPPSLAPFVASIAGGGGPRRLVPCAVAAGGREVRCVAPPLPTGTHAVSLLCTRGGRLAPCTAPVWLECMPHPPPPPGELTRELLRRHAGAPLQPPPAAAAAASRHSDSGGGGGEETDPSLLAAAAAARDAAPPPPSTAAAPWWATDTASTREDDSSARSYAFASLASRSARFEMVARGWADTH